MLIGVSLILPIILVLRSRSRPKLTLFAATSLALMILSTPVFYLFIVSSSRGDVQTALNVGALKGMAYITLIVSLPILFLVQRRTAKQSKFQKAESLKSFE